MESDSGQMWTLVSASHAIRNLSNECNCTSEIWSQFSRCIGYKRKWTTVIVNINKGKIQTFKNELFTRYVQVNDRIDSSDVSF